MRTLLFRSRPSRGQTLVETVLVMPLFIMVITGIIVLGIGLFYQQQVNTAAREAARYAAIHSATSTEPTCSWKVVNQAMVPFGMPVNTNCDEPSLRWPKMTAYARQLVFGLSPEQLHVAACWSGYTDYAIPDAHDAGPVSGDGTANDWQECTIGGLYPLTQTAELTCQPPLTTEADDKSSSLATSSGQTANRVSVYACYTWNPPLAGFLLIPDTVTLRAAISESMQHQR